MNRRGFTLAELLIVVAIIALLALILLPNLLRARKTALQTALSAHVRNVYTAYLAESAEHPLTSAEEVIQGGDGCDRKGATASGYPWTAPPPILRSCTVEVAPDGYGFIVRATDSDGLVYEAGR